MIGSSQEDLIMKAMIYSCFHYPDNFFDMHHDFPRFNKLKLYKYIDSELFKRNLTSWKSNTKGTPMHYLRFFPESNLLKDFISEIKLTNDGLVD